MFESPPEPLRALQSAPHVRVVWEGLRERSVSSCEVRECSIVEKRMQAIRAKAHETRGDEAVAY